MLCFCLRFCVFAAIAGCTALVAQQGVQTQTPPAPAPQTQPPATPQTPPPPQESAQPPSILEKKAYVKRFSAGVTGGYNILDLMSTEPMEQTFNEPFLRVRSTAETESKKYTFGATFQFAITGKYAINATALYKWAGYNLVNEYFVMRNASEVLALTTREETRARYWDLPVMVRRYNIDRFEEGWRWFVGIGGSMRYVTNISTTTTNMPIPGDPTTTTGAAAPSKRLLPGATAGIGLQFIDDFGIRFVPEVRYTRWFGATWDNLAAQSKRHQVEVLVSFTF